MNVFNPDWFLKYKEKLILRNYRIQNFIPRFILLRLLKSIVLIPLLPLLIIVFLKKSKKTIIYRPDIRHRNNLNSLKDALVIGALSDMKWAKENNYSFFPFYPIYTLSNFGFTFAWRFVFNFIMPKRILVWTDYGLDQYLATHTAKKLKIRSWCIQHGLFPSDNNKDLDGLDAEINVVSSIYQRNILEKAGFEGKTVIFDKLFIYEADGIPPVKHIDWIDAGKPIVFVGAGYTHNNNLEMKVLLLLEELKSSLGNQFKIIYRPHPRDAEIKNQVNKLKIKISAGPDSSFENPTNYVFLGIKSTFLVEAQNANRLVILLKGPDFPKYFENGEIKNELDCKNIKKLPDLINNSIY